MMAPSQRPAKKMVSRCNPETERGTLVFDIAGYSLLKGLGDGKFIRSASFAVGGHDWCIRYYPNGDWSEDCKGYVSIYLELMSKTTGTGVMACFDLRLLNQATGDSKVLKNQVITRMFEGVHLVWGTKIFMKTCELETSPYLKDDRIVIECDIAVVVGTLVHASETVCEIYVPPSDLMDDLRKLLEAEKRTDITFKVEEEVFQAHKFVLAMRSPVFEAELYGPMADKRRQIMIEDMQPAVFKALLHFIYTDSLPAMDDLNENEKEEMVKHLLVAADKYAMERMKLMCESIICKRLHVDSVATTLALADQHNCNKLKDACIGFISSKKKDDVMASKGYEHLKRVCPAIFMDIWENAPKSQKI
ncbi:hypothetical protein SEVIR_6G016900v4 [Setaria viridis]|nr:BTB/POZ and MATH domain-containing protein 3-like [Setaria viridis]